VSSKPTCEQVEARGISTCGVDSFAASLTAVEFDDQPRFHAAEINEVRANGMLPTELRAGELAAAQVAPQGRFGVAPVPAQRAGADAGGFCSPIALHGIVCRADLSHDGMSLVQPSDEEPLTPTLSPQENAGIGGISRPCTTRSVPMVRPRQAWGSEFHTSS
jgi:hypothetical protein